MNEILTLMKDKKELLDQMYLLSEKQSKILEGEKFEKLEDVLEDKGQIINEIDNIDSKIKEANIHEQTDNKDLDDLQENIKKILSKIKALDNDNNKKLSKAMNDMKSDIKDMRQGVRAMQNYSNNDPYESFASLGGTLFIDQDS